MTRRSERPALSRETQTPTHMETLGEDGCVHSFITVECAQLGCANGAVLTVHRPNGSTVGSTGATLPDGWVMVIIPFDPTGIQFACPSHKADAVAWVRRSTDLLLALEALRQKVNP